MEEKIRVIIRLHDRYEIDGMYIRSRKELISTMKEYIRAGRELEFRGACVLVSPRMVEEIEAKYIELKSQGEEKSNTVDHILERIDKVYRPESLMYLNVKLALTRLPKNDLAALLLMIKTSVPDPV